MTRNGERIQTSEIESEQLVALDAFVVWEHSFGDFLVPQTREVAENTSLVLLKRRNVTRHQKPLS